MRDAAMRREPVSDRRMSDTQRLNAGLAMQEAYDEIYEDLGDED